MFCGKSLHKSLFPSTAFTGEMKKPLVIGKATKPQGFRYINTEKLPVDWKTNIKKA
jgi:hypothetical protein